MGRFLISLLGVTMLSAVLLAPGSARAEGDTWTGFYGGAHGGYRWTDADFTSSAYSTTLAGFLVPFPARSEDYDLDSAILGLQLGYGKKRPDSNLYWGFEGDFSWGWGDDSRTTNGTAIGTPVTVGNLFTYRQFSEVEANWQATLRARLGWVDGPWLFFATAGIAWMDVDWRDTISVTGGAVPATSTFNNSKNFTLSGLVLGAGIERELDNPMWRARLEFLYENFGDENVPHGATIPAQIGNLDIDDAIKLRIAINRKIGR